MAPPTRARNSCASTPRPPAARSPAQQPDNNIVRVAIQALSAVLGGTQSLHTNGRDEALALPTEDAARIALRTQQIIGHESGVANTIDPIAGSYHLERLTNEIEEGAQRAAGAHRRRRRHAGGDRSRLHPAAGAGVGLQGAGRRRRRRGDRGRRQPLPDRRAVHHRGVPGGSRAGAAAAGARAECARDARRGALAGRARRGRARSRGRATTWCRRSSRRSNRTPPSAKLQIHFAACSASTAK